MKAAINIKVFAMALVCLASISCLKEKRQATYTAQEAKIDAYIAQKMYKTETIDGKQVTDTLNVVYNGGSSRLITKEGVGEQLKAGGTIAFYYAGYIFTGSKTLFATNHEETALQNHWELTDQRFEMITLELDDSDLIEGLRNGLIGVRSGERCEILFSGEYGYGKKPLGTVPANSALLFEIVVEAISNE